MLKVMLKWVIFACVILGVCYLPGIKVTNFAFAMLIAAILTFINIFVKPIIKLFTLPLNFMTFGLFNLVINFGILYVIAYFIPQLELKNILSAFYASIIIAISYTILKKV